MDLSVATGLATALAIGLIIGIERGWELREVREGLRSAGVRTFGLTGLFGGISALFAAELGVSAFAVALLGLTGIIIASYALTALQTKDFGATTELALLVTFGLGALAVRDFKTEAVAAAVVVTGLLGFKGELHHSLEHIDQQELRGTLQLLLIAAVILPLLPDQDLGPWQALNPRTIGLLVLLIAGISYVGYFAMRLFGTRVGLLVSAILGGLTSSTAATVSFARMARHSEASTALLGAGIALAAATMAIRLLLEVAVVNVAIIPRLVLPFAALTFVPSIAALVIARRTQPGAAAAPLIVKNPLELGTAVGFGAILALVFLLIRLAQTWFGDAGIYAVSAISGIADVDAVSLSLAQAANTDLPASVAATGILLVVFINTVVKALLATLIGGWSLARWCLPILLAALGLGFVVVLLTST